MTAKLHRNTPTDGTPQQPATTHTNQPQHVKRHHSKTTSSTQSSTDQPAPKHRPAPAASKHTNGSNTTNKPAPQHTKGRLCCVASANPLLVCHHSLLQAPEGLVTHGPYTVSQASNSLVLVTGVGSVNFWPFIVAWTRGGKGVWALKRPPAPNTHSHTQSASKTECNL